MEAKRVKSNSSGELLEFGSLNKRGQKGNIITVIAAYNEENRISPIVKNCLRFSKKVIVIDDGSIDSTADVARSLGALVVKHKKNLGKGNAIRTAIETLKNNKTEVIVFIDADGQDNPDFIPKLAEPILHGKADLAIGSRFIQDGKSAIPEYKVFGNQILTFITNLFTGFSNPVKESQCGFRAIRRDKLLDLNLRSNRFEIESEMIIEAAKSQLKIVEVPIKDNLVQEAIEKGTTILDGLKIVFALLRITFQKFLS
ncbi:glycosyltransferase family 2 protein [Candidatus Borrarchaeum sp.]|uniref:glycosyltransferase family 2 protein n=1 Tax=Candidatus Borrarchaeum sp. TaxID=2846742 RepID=UPI00257C9A43|nr:glycosyltransferase family 2 protein [Candidatus Borrarchaeum sp.]